MSISRRDFLKLAGISSLGIGFSATDLLWENRAEAIDYMSSPKGLTAKRWAMVVDLRKFKTEEDYSRVIDICHHIHNVPDFGNLKDEVKWIWTDTFEHVFPFQKNEYLPEGVQEKKAVLFCNHCDNPPCVRVCPTQATFKRKDGIVAQDYHRCIGCRFCMAACPFGSRSFNWRDPRPFIKRLNPEFPTRTKGVVEKCNFCVERLAKGLKPACVEVSNGGLIFGDLSDPESEVRKILSKHYSLRRKAELGTRPSVFYIIGGDEDA
ncbi:tetrathionate reductase subunit B precursor [bacterium BMS3Bbin07]|nr:tetrathionate reductase subunit B precursor [bacterium BMS3Bbin07]